MAQLFVFINERQQTSTELKARLDLSKSAAEKFDALNNHIRNVVVLPGQLVIIGDPATAVDALRRRSFLHLNNAW